MTRVAGIQTSCPTFADTLDTLAGDAVLMVQA